MFTEYEYFGIVTSFKGFQVQRFFFLQKNYRQGRKAEFFNTEVCQHWINPDGALTIMGRSVQWGSLFYDRWIKSSELEIKHYHKRYDINPVRFYPRMRLSANVKRNGFCGDFHYLSPTKFLCAILSSPKAETLLKAGQINMLSRYIQTNNLDQFWASIKICIRNNYLIQDARTWCDHIDILKFLGKDILNPKFICPTDLKGEHQHLIEKARVVRKKQKIEAQKAKFEQDEIEYIEEKGRFFGLKFSDQNIEVSVLDSVTEFIKEGEELHHCVYENEYYKDKEALILSAKKDNKRLETIEISLNEMKIVQCRGAFNEETQYHDTILSLVERNIGEIQKRCG